MRTKTIKAVKASDFFRSFAQMLVDQRDMLDALDPTKASFDKLVEAAREWAFFTCDEGLSSPALIRMRTHLTIAGARREFFLRFANLLETKRDLIEARDPKGENVLNVKMLVQLTRAYGRDYAKIDLLGSGKIAGISKGTFQYQRNGK